MKTFNEDLMKFSSMLSMHEPFAFNRFSDGELYILENKELVLDNNLIKIGEQTSYGPYKSYDFKHFDPTLHKNTRLQLLDSFQCSKENYYKGISCICCTTPEIFKWQIDLMQHGKDEWLTWANLFVNGNYNNFFNHIFTKFYDYKVVILCHESADLSRLPFITKDFRVGYNAMINNYDVIEKMKCWITDNNIKDHLFLFSASTLSKLAIHQLYSFNNKNIYLDIGTTLSPMMGMGFDRSYLRSYWMGTNEPDGRKVCIWKEI